MSNRPIHRRVVIGRPMYRTPRTEYETPRLNERKAKDVIGFVTRQLPGHQQIDATLPRQARQEPKG